MNGAGVSGASCGVSQRGPSAARQQVLAGSSTRIACYVSLRYGSCDQEVMGAIFVDTRNRLLGEREIR